MIQGMTGFGSQEKEIASLGRVRVEIRSLNHKFQETVLHLPAGFMSLEERVKKQIEARIKRGRVTCVIDIFGAKAQQVFINKMLLKNYLLALRAARKEFCLDEGVRLDTLIHLPGILSLTEERLPKERAWPQLKSLVDAAMADVVRMRKREGLATYAYLKKASENLETKLTHIRERFKSVIKHKVSLISNNEERVKFLKESDITEEMERLKFHSRNFKSKLTAQGAVGKELDFIAQEMQREANTIAAKSCDAMISASIVQIKSQIEKIREQVQNVE
jgi:uncharacterized protein (TIGR00255 family)